jgi:hypothetical protein
MKISMPRMKKTIPEKKFELKSILEMKCKKCGKIYTGKTYNALSNDYNCEKQNEIENEENPKCDLDITLNYSVKNPPYGKHYFSVANIYY